MRKLLALWSVLKNSVVVSWKKSKPQTTHMSSSDWSNIIFRTSNRHEHVHLKTIELRTDVSNLILVIVIKYLSRMIFIEHGFQNCKKIEFLLGSAYFKAIWCSLNIRRTVLQTSNGHLTCSSFGNRTLTPIWRFEHSNIKLLTLFVPSLWKRL